MADQGLLKKLRGGWPLFRGWSNGVGGFLNLCLLAALVAVAGSFVPRGGAASAALWSVTLFAYLFLTGAVLALSLMALFPGAAIRLGLRRVSGSCARDSADEADGAGAEG